ncbi:MAG: methyltransferase [Paracoccaceae bacterium]|nr:methyltransferase [Paracoccaceae bacterium]
MDDKAFSTRIWQSCLATQELLCIYIGLKLGLYDTLSQQALTAEELATQLQLDQRYLSEWLAQQVTAGILVSDEQNRCFLPDAHAEALARSDTALSRIAGILPIGGVAAALPQLLAAYRDGRGVPDSAFGEDWECGHAGANLHFFQSRLTAALRDKLPDIYLRLLDEGGHIVDLGCGTGGASLAFARSFPRAHVTGVDVAEHGLRALERDAAEMGLAARIDTQHSLNALKSPVTLIVLIDTLHEVGRPIELLSACKDLLDADGCIVVIDALVADTAQSPGDEVERFQATTSVLHCLPAARAFESSDPTGTMLRRPLMKDIASQAGLRITMSSDLDDRFHRLYRLECAPQDLEITS